MAMLKAFLPLLFLTLVGCKEQELLKGLDQTQSNEIIALLQRNNIVAAKSEVAKEGYSVKVGSADFSAAVDLMNTYDLPSRPRLQIAEMFPSDSLISSPRAEKARLYSGIEQRLEQSLHTLQGVVSARVHVSYDLNATEGGKNKDTVHLSALIKYDTDSDDATLMINDVKRFLKNSFNNVDYENISVVLTGTPPVQHQAPIVSQRGAGNTLWLLLMGGILLLGTTAAFFLYQKRQMEKVKLKDKGEEGNAK